MTETQTDKAYLEQFQVREKVEVRVPGLQEFVYGTVVIDYGRRLNGADKVYLPNTKRVRVELDGKRDENGSSIWVSITNPEDIKRRNENV